MTMVFPGLPGFLQRGQDAAHLFVDEGDLAIGVGDDLAQLVIALRVDPRIGRPYGNLGCIALGRVLDRGAVPPGAVVEVAGAVARQVDLGRVVQARPGLGAVEGMVRVDEADPGAERLVLVPPVAQPFHRAVGGPGSIVPVGGQLRMPGLRAAGARPGLVQPRAFLALAVGVEESLVMQPLRRGQRRVVGGAGQHQLHVVEAHVGAEPLGPVVDRGQHRLGPPRGFARVVAGEMRLAEEAGVIASLRQRSGEALLAGLLVKVDAVVMHPVGAAQLPGEDRGARRLAHRPTGRWRR